MDLLPKGLRRLVDRPLLRHLVPQLVLLLPLEEPSRWTARSDCLDDLNGDGQLLVPRCGSVQPLVVLADRAVYLVAHVVVRRATSSGEDVVGMRRLDTETSREEVVHFALFDWSAHRRSYACLCVILVIVG